MCDGHYVDEFVGSSVYNRKRKPSEDEVTQVLVDLCTQLRMVKQDVDDSLDFVSELETQP